MTYPPSLQEQAQVLRLAGHSFRDIQRQLGPGAPSIMTIWNWCERDIDDSVRLKARDYEQRLASMAQSLLEVKLQEALEQPEDTSLLTANIVAGTRIDKLIAYERLDADRQHNSALDILAAIATRQQELQAASGKSPDAMWRIISPADEPSDSDASPATDSATTD